MNDFSSHLIKAQSGVSLPEDDMAAAMTLIMEGRVCENDLSGFLLALARRGETAAEITGAARIMREKALRINAPGNAVDCCGTGGDSTGTYNISTAVAVICAAAGVPVAKHGNRAASSRSGAADVLERLGVNLDAPQERLEQALHDMNFAFLMAPRYHSAMKHVAPVRKKLGRRTIFNLLGPLANPAGTKRQLIGVYDQKWLVPMAEALRNLGTEKAWIVHGSDGMDEITVTGATHIAILENGTITEKTVTPEDFGLPVSGAGALQGGDPDANAAALSALLEGEKSAYRDIVLANAAAVLNISGTAGSLPEGIGAASKAIDSGRAKALLADYIALTQKDRAA